MFLACFYHHLTFLLILCTLSYLLYYFMLQDAMLTLSVIVSGQCCACVWQFCVAPLEL